MNMNRELKKIKVGLLNVIVQNWFCYLYLKKEHKQALIDYELFDAEKNGDEKAKIAEVLIDLEKYNKKGCNNQKIKELKVKAVELNQEAGQYLINKELKEGKGGVDKYWDNTRESLYQYSIWGKGISDVKAMIEAKEMIKK